MTTNTIDRFVGRYGFLSNFHVEHDGRSGEHRFQAAKTLDRPERRRVLAAATPGESKGLGRRVQLRSDWERVKVSVMAEVVATKFKDPVLRQLLFETGDAALIEGNTWGDTFWGVDSRTGDGRNVLGEILMTVRAHIRPGETRTPAPVRSFDAAYRFLSNFWPTSDGLTAEHHYQAAKCRHAADRDMILGLPTAGDAKRAGQEVEVREDWDEVKVLVMAEAVARKFSDPELGALLLATGDRQLIEGNHWGDVFWGVDDETGEGRNVLGTLLMGVRATLRAAQ